MPAALKDHTLPNPSALQSVFIFQSHLSLMPAGGRTLLHVILQGLWSLILMEI